MLVRFLGRQFRLINLLPSDILNMLPLTLMTPTPRGLKILLYFFNMTIFHNHYSFHNQSTINVSKQRKFFSDNFALSAITFWLTISIMEVFHYNYTIYYKYNYIHLKNFHDKNCKSKFNRGQIKINRKKFPLFRHIYRRFSELVLISGVSNIEKYLKNYMPF